MMTKEGSNVLTHVQIHQLALTELNRVLSELLVQDASGLFPCKESIEETSAQIQWLEQQIFKALDSEGVYYHQGDDGVWVCSKCDMGWSFEGDDLPSTQGLNYCPGCGGLVLLEIEHIVNNYNRRDTNV